MNEVSSFFSLFLYSFTGETNVIPSRMAYNHWGKLNQLAGLTSVTLNSSYLNSATSAVDHRSTSSTAIDVVVVVVAKLSFSLSRQTCTISWHRRHALDNSMLQLMIS